jgi:hypothetical protein
MTRGLLILVFGAVAGWLILDGNKKKPQTLTLTVGEPVVTSIPREGARTPQEFTADVTPTSLVPDYNPTQGGQGVLTDSRPSSGSEWEFGADVLAGYSSGSDLVPGGSSIN